MANQTQYVSGLRELARKLEQLPVKLQRNGLRKAVSSGAAVVRNAVKESAPIGATGTLRRAVSMKRAKTPDAQIATYEVFVRQAKNGKVGSSKIAAYGKYDAYYWRFVEFGTSKAPAHPFLRPAWGRYKNEARDVIISTLREKIAEAAA